MFDEVEPMEPIVDKSIVADLEAPIVPEAGKVDEIEEVVAEAPEVTSEAPEAVVDEVPTPTTEETSTDEKTQEDTAPSEETPKTVETPTSDTVENPVEKNTPEVQPKKKKKKSFT